MAFIRRLAWRGTVLLFTLWLLLPSLACGADWPAEITETIELMRQWEKAHPSVRLNYLDETGLMSLDFYMIDAPGGGRLQLVRLVDRLVVWHDVIVFPQGTQVLGFLPRSGALVTAGSVTDLSYRYLFGGIDDKMSILEKVGANVKILKRGNGILELVIETNPGQLRKAGIGSLRDPTQDNAALYYATYRYTIDSTGAIIGFSEKILDETIRYKVSVLPLKEADLGRVLKMRPSEEFISKFLVKGKSLTDIVQDEGISLFDPSAE